MVIGAIPVQYCGRPRTSWDVDLMMMSPIKCYICGRSVGKIPIKTMKMLLDDFLNSETFNEWIAEMKAMKTLHIEIEDS